MQLQSYIWLQPYATEDIIETLCPEESTTLPLARGNGTRFPEYTSPGNIIHLTAMTPVTTSSKVKATFHEDDYETTISPVSVTFEYRLINNFLLEWNTKNKKLRMEKSPQKIF